MTTDISRSVGNTMTTRQVSHQATPIEPAKCLRDACPGSCGQEPDIDPRLSRLRSVAYCSLRVNGTVDPLVSAEVHT